MIKKMMMGFVTLIVLGIIGISILVGMPSTEKLDPLTYFSEFKNGQQNMVFNDIRVDWEKPTLIQDGIIYIEANWLNMHVNDRIYYDEVEQVLTITNLEEVIRVYPNENKMTINGQTVDPIIDIVLEQGKLYIDEGYLEQEYAVNIEQGKDERLVVVSTNHEEARMGEVKRKGELRTHADSKKPIVDEVVKGEQVMIYSQVGKHLRVRNENGMVGYIPEKCIEVIGDVQVLEEKQYKAKEVAQPLNDKVRLVWDQLTVRTPGDWSSSKYANVKNANVISPTWFEFADEQGNLIDRGTMEYVQSAHQRGLQVWPLISHNFTEPQFTKPILMSTAKRQHVINQLLELVQKYNVQGINIDIENVQKDFGNEWVQFMRELYPQMQQIGKTVSVDVYMPSAWSGHYHRDKVAEVVDYFMVMAYDQHWAGSDQAGPTAGLTWVEQGIQANLQEVPAEKLVLGIPFFTRIWEETSQGLSSKAYSMKEAKNIASKWGVDTYYDEEHQQNYMQRHKEGVISHIWIEDEETISKRIQLIETYSLAGYAGWKLGLEGTEVWDELQKMK